MHHDADGSYRALLENDPPAFLDRVNTPWDQVPDLEEYNHLAYRRIVRALEEISRQKAGHRDANSRGILVLNSRAQFCDSTGKAPSGQAASGWRKAARLRCVR